MTLYLRVFLFLFLTIPSLSFSQEITLDHGFWGYKFKQGEKELSWKQLLQETETHEESYDLIKRAQSQNTLSSIFGFTGGLLVGYPLGQALANGETNWTLMIVGGAMITVAIPLSSSSKRNLKDGLSSYNSRNKSSNSKEFSSNLEVIGNARGLGIRMNF